MPDLFRRAARQFHAARLADQAAALTQLPLPLLAAAALAHLDGPLSLKLLTGALLALAPFAGRALARTYQPRGALSGALLTQALIAGMLIGAPGVTQIGAHGALLLLSGAALHLALRERPGHEEPTASRSGSEGVS